jgi:hypothetical protein
LSENLPLLIDAEPNTVSLLWVASYLAVVQMIVFVLMMIRLRL